MRTQKSQMFSNEDLPGSKNQARFLTEKYEEAKVTEVS